MNNNIEIYTSIRRIAYSIVITILRYKMLMFYYYNIIVFHYFRNKKIEQDIFYTVIYGKMIIIQISRYNN